MSFHRCSVQKDQTHVPQLFSGKNPGGPKWGYKPNYFHLLFSLPGVSIQNLTHEQLDHHILTGFLKFLSNFLFLCYLHLRHFQIFPLVTRGRKKDQHHSQCIFLLHIHVWCRARSWELISLPDLHVLISLEPVKCLVLDWILFKSHP